MKCALLCGGSIAALMLTCGPLAAYAAEAATTASGASSAAAPATSIGELVVVAQKRAEKLQTVPVAISAYTSEQRDILGIASVQDLTDYTPGLSYTSYSNRPYVRGVGRQTDNLAVESGVAVYVDGVFNGANASTILQSDSLFIDRIEVLRGPQSTLYGRNADGGAINYVTKRPTKTWEAELRTGYDSYGKWFGEGVMSGPITDWLRYRVGGNYTRQDGGYYKNLDGTREGGSVAQGGNGEAYHIEVQFEGNIGSNLDFWVKGATSNYNVSFHTQTLLGPLDTREFSTALMPNQNYGLCAMPGGGGGLGCTINPAAGTFDHIVSVTTLPNALPGNPSDTQVRNFDADFKSRSGESKDAIFATGLTYHFPTFDVKYLFGYQNFSYNLRAPWLNNEGVSSGVESYVLQGPTTVQPLCGLLFSGNLAGCTQNLTVNGAQTQFTFDEYENFFSHEVDFTSTGTGKLQWLAGIYYYHEYYDQPINVLDPSQAQVGTPLTFGFAPAPLNPSRSVYSEDTVLHEDSVAAFAQADWQFTPTLKLTGGVRYSNDRKYGQEAFRVILFDASEFGLGASTFGANTPAFDATACPTVNYVGTKGCSIDPATGKGVRLLNARWGAWTGTVNLAWTPDSDTLVYGKYSRGYKTGGFNSGILAANPETQPETVDAFEIGFKKTIAHVFQANVSAFYYDYANDQQPLGVYNPVSQTISTQIFNIPTVHSYGVEVETLWQPINNLTLSVNYAYISSTVASTGGQCLEDTADPAALAPGANTTGCPAPTGGIQLQNIKGASLPETPNNKVSVDGIYKFNFDPGSLTVAASLVWKDKEYSSPFNRQYNLAPSYTQVNLRATWTDAKNRYSLVAYADNIFDTLGYDNAYGVAVTNPGPSQAISRLVSLTAPRTFGVEFQYRFR